MFSKNSVYLLSLICPILTIVGNSLGGWWTALPLGILLSLSPLDWLWQSTAPVDTIEHRLPNFILVTQGVVHSLTVISLIAGVTSGILNGPYFWLAIISTGFVTGSGALVTAHELIHRVNGPMYKIGLWLLFVHNYSNYAIEHVQGHHVNVALATDVTTARFGENFYSFLARVVPQQYYTALQIEAQVCRRRGLSPFGFQNSVISFSLLKIVLLIAGLVWLGPVVIGAYLLQSVIARVLYESGSYVQHYGLERIAGERIQPHHAWESDSVLSRILLDEITLHSDHHCHVTRPFESLQTQANSFKLPAGSFGLLMPVLIPSIWFAIAHPILKANLRVKV